MSRTKKKHVVKLYPGQSAVVMDYNTLMYLAQTCDLLAEQQDFDHDSEAWRAVADDIRYQTEENHYVDEEEQEDWAY